MSSEDEHDVPVASDGDDISLDAPRRSSRQPKKPKVSDGIANLRAIKEGRMKRSEQFQIRKEEDIYEVVDDEQYRKIMQIRRKRGDFVVGDEDGYVRFLMI